MEFYIEKHSSSSVIRQIQEQIKLAVAMGVFRRGDTLPSIRDVEKQTGINRGLVHKEYLDLRKSGLLTLARGKGTVIATGAPSPPPMTEKCKQLSVDIVSKARQAGISPTAFARYLSHHAQEDERNAPFIAYIEPNKEDATERADQISQVWQVPVVGLTIQELKNNLRDGSKLRKVLVNYFFYDRVKSLLSGRKIDVIPIATRGSEQTPKHLHGLKRILQCCSLSRGRFTLMLPSLLLNYRNLLSPAGLRCHICRRTMSRISRSYSITLNMIFFS